MRDRAEAYQIFPVGWVKKRDSAVFIEVDDKYKDALLGLEQFSHIQVLYWFHENDTPSKRSVLQVHPRNDRRNPLAGVFATHSPVRPNLLALTTCRIVSIKENVIAVEAIDALDGTPVIDIKSYTGRGGAAPPIRMPEWARFRKKHAGGAGKAG